MGRVAYSIADAATASAVSSRDIEMAINAGHLTARRIGSTLVILATDIQAWVEAAPNWLDERVDTPVGTDVPRVGGSVGVLKRFPERKVEGKA